MLIYNLKKINKFIDKLNYPPIYIKGYFDEKCLSTFKQYLDTNFPILIFDNCLGGDLSLLPEINNLMSEKCCIGIVKNYIASLHLAIFGLSTIKIINENSYFFYHAPIFPLNYEKRKREKLLRLYEKNIKFLAQFENRNI